MTLTPILKEKIEEAADKYANDSFIPMRNSEGDILRIPTGQSVQCGFSKHKKASTKHFINGAKWASETICNIDEFAIKFAEWSWNEELVEINGECKFFYRFNLYSTKELLEIFKKEKGL